MFAYCNNCPTNAVDSAGLFLVKFFKDFSKLLEGATRKALAKTVIKQEKYSASNYNSASLAKKKEVLNAYAQDVGRALNICDPPSVKYQEMPPTDGKLIFGYYNDEDNELTLNEWVLKQDYAYYMFSVTRHELFHAYQHRIIRGELQTEPQIIVDLWREADKNYEEDLKNQYSYEHNALEVYANDFAR